MMNRDGANTTISKSQVGFKSVKQIANRLQTDF